MKNRKLLNIELGRITPEEYKEMPGSGIVLVLDNIRSAHNIGSAFRTADSFRAEKIFLCGICVQKRQCRWCGVSGKRDIQ